LPSTSSSGGALVARTLRGLCALALVGCFEGPLERDNILDPGAGATISIAPGYPDTLYTSLESFVAVAQLNRSVPETITGLKWEVAENVIALGHSGGGFFYAQPTAGLAPITARFRVYVLNREGPVAEATVVVRKRVANVVFACGVPTSNCPTMNGIGAVGQMTMVLRDAAGFLIPTDNSSVRFGTMDSTDPTVVEVLDRLTQGTARIRAVGGGGAWIRLIGEVTRDSIYVTVVP
jgi:hypothetical protein